MTGKPHASVVIPTFSRPDLLPLAVQSVLNQVTPFAFEVIVVDDGGRPAAEDILRSLKDGRLRVLTQPNAGPAKARNLGLRNAQGDYVVFMDDDCQANAGWLAAGVAAFQDGVVMVQGPVAPPHPASPLEFHYVETGMARHDYSCNMFVRREDAAALDGFDESFTFAAGEDFDFALRMEKRGTVVFAPGAAMTHALLPMKWAKRRRRPDMWVSFFRLAALHPEKFNNQLMIPVLGRVVSPVLKQSPSLHILASLVTMQFAYIHKDAARTGAKALVEEVAASLLNAGGAVARIPKYKAAYARALQQRAQGRAAPENGAARRNGSGAP